MASSEEGDEDGEKGKEARGSERRDVSIYTRR
jgi:hypothetical protein